jgi:hypothetical protein
VFHAVGDDPCRDYRRPCRICGEGAGHPLHLLDLPGVKASLSKLQEQPVDLILTAEPYQEPTREKQIGLFDGLLT